MKIRNIIPLLFICVLTSCSSPQDYFNTCTLNANLVTNFGSGDLRNFYPVQKEMMYDPKTKEMRMANTFVEEYSAQFVFVETVLDQVNALKPTEETKPMIAASKDLFGFVLKVYHTDYLNIAKLRDQNASKEAIQQAIVSIDKNYGQEFQQKYNTLLKIGLDYAHKHDIKVNTFSLH